MRGGSIVTTFIFSIIFLKIKVMKNQVAGAALALFGVMIVGLSNMVFSDNSGSDQNAVLYLVKIGFTNCWIFTNYSFFVHQWFSFCV
jgi:drug/metabolite transporter (DMT)-like permease